MLYEPTSRELKRDVVSQSQSIAKLRVDAACAIKKLAQENDRLRLYCAALARLLLEKGLISVPEISEMIALIDPEDGFRDGRLSGRLLPGEKPTPSPVLQKPKSPKPVGRNPSGAKQTLPKPPAHWKQNIEAKKNQPDARI